MAGWRNCIRRRIDLLAGTDRRQYNESNYYENNEDAVIVVRTLVSCEEGEKHETGAYVSVEFPTTSLLRSMIYDVILCLRYAYPYPYPFKSRRMIMIFALIPSL